jgi:hypothetical protein
MKGPMTTQTLRGLLNLSPYHWRGDKPNFAAFNAAFSFVDGRKPSSPTRTWPPTAPSPIASFSCQTLIENLDRSLPAVVDYENSSGSPVNGETDFMTLTLMRDGQTCNDCHTANPGPGSDRLLKHCSSTAAESTRITECLPKAAIQQERRAEHRWLRNDQGWRTSPAVSGFFTGSSFKNYSATQKLDMSAYELCFDTGTAPAAGYTRTLTAANVTGAPIQSDWATLQSQAAAGNIDLIGRGTIQSQLHGLLYQPASGTYISDTNTTYTQTQLQGFVQAGDTISIMGVYPGTGTTQ